MLKLRKRGRKFHVDLMQAHHHLVRGSLGTTNRNLAHRLAFKLEMALYETRNVALWEELKRVLPPKTFDRFASFAGIQNQHGSTWRDLRSAFSRFAEQRISFGALASSTYERYQQTFTHFDRFLASRGIHLLREITAGVMDDFKADRAEGIRKSKNSRGGGGLALDIAIMHRILSFAKDRGMVVNNPVRLEKHPGANPQNGAEPFSAEELHKLRGGAGQDLLAFKLLRWTGLRGSDAVDVTIGQVDVAARELMRTTHKRKIKIIVPLHSEVLGAITAERERRGAKPSDRILLNPYNQQPLTRRRLYHRMLALGERVGVSNARPHRFRDTFAVDLLVRGATPYDVAKVLGDAISTVEQHYVPFVRALRERVLRILSNGAGLEEIANRGPELAGDRSNTPADASLSIGTGDSIWPATS